MPPKILLIDWDSTLTIKDTMSTFAFIGYGFQTPSHSKAKPWSEIVDAYLSEYHAHEASYKTPKTERKTVQSELSWLSSLYKVERSSFCRFESIGLFNNMSKAELQIRAVRAVREGQVELRPGWLDLFQASSEASPIQTSIISVHWSAAFIRGCLLQGAELEEQGKASQMHLQHVPVHANEMCTSVSSRACTDEAGIHTSDGKLAVLRKIVSVSDAESVVYVGDSTSDLHCLLAADLGICIRNEESPSSSQTELMETLQRIGIEVEPLRNLKFRDIENRSSRYPVATRVWWTSSLKDILSILKPPLIQPEL
jgi:thiamine phosphate phosphatase / amino-HMP aminohydrolase